MNTHNRLYRGLSYFTVLSFLLFMFACSQDDEKLTNTGILRLNIKTNTSVITKADTDVILTIKSKENGWSKEYNYSESDEIELNAGSYEIIATSGNNNDNRAGFDTPFYMGKEEVSIIAGQTNSVTIECTLTTVKISVQYGEDVKNSFVEGFKTVVTNNSGELTFSQTEKRSGYFTPGELSVKFMYLTAGEWVTVPMENIADAKAREHYTLKFSVKNTGENPDTEGVGNVEIDIEDSSKEEININIKLPSKVVGTTLEPNTWAKFAYLKGEIDAELSASEALFEWRVKGEADWNLIENAIIEKENGIYQTVLTNGELGLEIETTYEYRFQGGNIVEFTTEGIPTVPNMGFDIWSSIEKSSITGKKYTWYANDDKANSYWSTGNEGVILMTTSNTVPVESDRPNSEYYAKLTSVFVNLFITKIFAAGNLFTGTYETQMSDPIKSAVFGREYSGRPTKLSGWMKYTPKTIDQCGSGYESYKGTTDKCEIYVMLFNTDNYTGDNIPKNPIAYGSFSTDETISEWTRFEFPLVYNDLESIPTKIAIVSSSSIHGAFFTGGTGSELCIDDFELSFDYDPRIEGEN